MLSALLLAALLAGPRSEPDTTFRLARGATIEIESRNRNVIIRTSTTAMATVRGGSVDVDGNSVSVDSDEEGSQSHGPLEVVVPVWARVEVNTVSGNVTVEAGPDRVQAETMNGNITITGGAGTLDLSSVAGNITVNEFRGTNITADATGGNIKVTNTTAKLDIESVGGMISLRGIRTTYAAVSTTSGTVDFEGPLAAEGVYRFESHNGTTTLYLPSDVSARFNISTFNGRFESQIPATTSPHREQGEDFTATIGRGDANVSIESFNGMIRIRRIGSK